jgi:predicted  nucleic acid-binding Zn-ribbon protein
LKEYINVLKDVQTVDKKLFDINQQLSRFPLQIKELDLAFEKEKAALDAAQALHKQKQLDLKKKELDLQDKEDKVKKLDGQLGQVKTNKEYAAIQEEIRALKADGSIIEESVITCMDEVSKLDKEVTQEKQVLKTKETELAQKKQVIQAQAKEIEGQLAALKAERETKIQSVDAELRQAYEKLLPRKQGLALAQVIGDNCGVCQIRLRPQTINEALRGEQLVACENCSRFLYSES